MKRPVTAVILGGGKGTRLRTVVSDRPKVMAEVAGRPFLSYLLDQLIGADVFEAVISTGYMASAIRDTYGHRYRDLAITYAHEESPLGTGGAIKFAAESAGHQTLLAMNGDSFVNVSLSEFLDFHAFRQNDASFVLLNVDDTARFGSVILDEDDRIVEFQEKNDRHENGLINGGIYAIKRALLAAIPSGPSSFERDVAPTWIREQRTIRGYRTSGEFIDIGIPDSYAQSHQFMEQLRHGLTGIKWRFSWIVTEPSTVRNIIFAIHMTWNSCRGRPRGC